VTPATALKGTDINVTLTGTFFDSTLRLVYGTSQSGTVIPDPGVVVDNINVISSTTATATVHVSAAAFFGSHAAMVTTLGGSVVRLNSLNVIPVVPVLTGISPAVGEQGTSVNVTMTGSFPGPGVGVNAVSGIGVTNIAAGEEVLTATFNISSSATLGLRDVVVSNNGGSSQPVSFLVIRRVPTVFSLSPNAGLVGSSVNVTLNGAGFIPGGTSLTVSGAPGVTVSNVNASSSSLMTVTLTIAPNAEIGPRNLTITNAGGTTDVVFTVALPFPDLRPSSSHTGNFVVGFQETYTVLVQNVGTAATTGAITLTDTLPASISFVSGTGNGWSCVAAAQIVQCLNAGPLNVGASSTIAMVDRQTSAGTVTHTVTVASPGDHNSSNDSATESITAVTAPLPTLLLPLSVTPGQQSTVDLRLQNPFFRDLTGILTLTFTPGGPNPINDPAIQFVTGGRQVAFTIPANTLQARFGANPVASPVGFQTGSVAGTFQFGATLDSGQALPSSSTLTILNQAPAIVGAVSDTQNGFALVVTLLAPGRQVDSIEMVFITGANVQFGCGSVPGCTAGPATITLDLKSLFENWFSVDRALGSMSQLRVPLAISGVVTGRVIVRMRNSLAASNGVQVFLP
jgi:uncharacterized repeat protein (TIGR01451 family)